MTRHFPEVKMTMTSKCFQSVQDIKATMLAQVNILMGENFRAASECGKNDGTNVFEEEEYFEGNS